MTKPAPTFKVMDQNGEITNHQAVHVVHCLELQKENAKLRELLNKARAGLDYNLLAAWGQEDLEDQINKVLND